MSAGLAAAFGAGIANNVGDAGAMLKSLVVLVVAVESVVPLVLLAVLASFCCAQSGRANSAPNATVAHHLRIVSSSLKYLKNPVDFTCLASGPPNEIDGGHRTTPSVLLVPQTLGGSAKQPTRSARDGMNKSLWVKAYSISSSFCKYFLRAPRARILGRGGRQISFPKFANFQLLSLNLFPLCFPPRSSI